MILPAGVVEPARQARRSVPAGTGETAVSATARLRLQSQGVSLELERAMELQVPLQGPRRIWRGRRHFKAPPFLPTKAILVRQRPAGKPTII